MATWFAIGEANDIAVQRRAREGAQRPTRPSDCNGRLASLRGGGFVGKEDAAAQMPCAFVRANVYLFSKATVQAIQIDLVPLRLWPRHSAVQDELLDERAKPQGRASQPENAEVPDGGLLSLKGHRGAETNVDRHPVVPQRSLGRCKRLPSEPREHGLDNDLPFSSERQGPRAYHGREEPRA